MTEMPRIPVSDGQLSYLTRGSPDSPPVLFLHGLGSCGEDWLLQLPELESDFLVILPDLRGHGRSSDMPTDIRIEHLAEDMVKVVRQVADQPAHVVGLSLGGLVALQLGIDHQDWVKSLTLVNTFPRFRTTPGMFVRGMIRSFYLLSGRMDLLADWLARGLFPNPDQVQLREIAAARIASNSKRNYIRAARAIARFNVQKRLGSIKAQSLVVAGDRDRTVPYQAAVALKEGILRAQLQVVEDSGHATPIDAFEDFNQILRDFLLQVEVEATESVARLR
jgi:pimeloyl-ACP methyl ester carboxylesterase